MRTSAGVWKFIIVLLLAAIEIFEFMATMQLVPLISESNYSFILDSTLYSYGAMTIIKLIVLLWLFTCHMQEPPTSASLFVRIVQAFSIWIGSCFLPYGDFLMDCGYKKF